MLQRLTVSAGEHRYAIIIDDELLNHGHELSAIIGDRTPYIISNHTVAPLYLEKITNLIGQSVDSYLVPDGERYKSFAQFELIINNMLELCLGRDTIIIALGGGVVGDLAGFVAACYQRGIPFIQIPTTLLAQVDASVGGKTAINHPAGKNMVGAFHQPSLVMIGTNTLYTLPTREYLAGLAEVVKYGLILDADFFAWLTENTTNILAKEISTLSFMIKKCCLLKAEVVRQDEKETGIRAILNLGHTFAHAIEAETKYLDYLHGEAVAIGLVAAMRLSIALNKATSIQLKNLVGLLTKLELPVCIPKHIDAAVLYEHMKKDKKNSHGKIRFVLNNALGKASVNIVDDKKLIMEAVPYHR